MGYSPGSNTIFQTELLYPAEGGVAVGVGIGVWEHWALILMMNSYFISVELLGQMAPAICG